MSLALDWVEVLGGAGTFLFSLRFLTRLLQVTLSRRLKASLAGILSSRLRCFMAGFLATLLVVQASSITIVTGMSLLAASLVDLERAFYLVLGAGLGSSLKFFALIDVVYYGPLLVGCCSLALVFLRRPVARELAETFMAIGFAFWGLRMLTHGLEPIARSPEFHALVRQFAGDTVFEQAMGMLLGTLLAMAVQSSTTVVLLTIALAEQGGLSYHLSAALVLGANLGTTGPILLASLEYQASVRRLAVAYFLMRALGLVATLLLFPSFLGSINLILGGDLQGRALGVHLAAVHTGFNLMSAFTWGLFPGLILKLSSALVPSQGGQQLDTIAVPQSVRKMLSRAPDLSLAEAMRELDQLLVLFVKSTADQICALLLDENVPLTRPELRLSDQSLFEGLKESIRELLVQSIPSGGDSPQVRWLLRRLLVYQDLYYRGWRLRERLEQGLGSERSQLPAELRPELEILRQAMEERWLYVLFGEQSQTPVHDLERVVSNLEDACFQCMPAMRSEEQSWTYDLVAAIHDFGLALGRLEVKAPAGKGELEKASEAPAGKAELERASAAPGPGKAELEKATATPRPGRSDPGTTRLEHPLASSPAEAGPDQELQSPGLEPDLPEDPVRPHPLAGRDT